MRTVASFLLVLSLAVALPRVLLFHVARDRLQAAQGGPRGRATDGQQATPAPRFGVVEYPPRPPADPAAVERGKALYGVNCTFCHGTDARGGDGGGPNLIRSTVVLDDQHGELIGPLLSAGRGAMPAFTFRSEQVQDLADFLHGFPVNSQSTPSTSSKVCNAVSIKRRFMSEWPW